MTVSKAKNTTYQNTWLKDNRHLHNARRVLQRALEGKNVTYRSLQKHGLENRVTEINEARKKLKPKPADPITETLIDNIDSADLARAVEQTELMREQTVSAEQIQQHVLGELTQAQNNMVEAIQDRPTQQVPLDARGKPVTTLTVDDNRLSLPLDPELFPKADENEVAWTDIMNFFMYVYDEYKDGRKGLSANIRKVLVNRTYDDRTDADTFIAQYPMGGWKDHFGNNQLQRLVLTVAGCESVKDKTLLKCMTKKDKNGQYHIINELTTRYTNPNTRVTYANAVMWLMDRYPNMYAVNKGMIPLHKALVKFANKKRDEADVAAKAKGETARRTQTHMQMPFQEIQDFVNGHQEFKDIKETQHKLFFAFYKEVPVRDNFGRVHIYKDMSEIKKTLRSPNMLYLPTKGNASFYLNKYKTDQGKDMGAKTYDLSAELTKLIRDTLKTKQRDFLFVLPDAYAATPVRNETPAENNNGDYPIAGKLIDPVFGEMQQKLGDQIDVTGAIDNLRKAVIGEAHAALDAIQLTKKQAPGYAETQKQLLAKRMLHSVATANKNYVNIPLHSYENKFSGLTKAAKKEAWQYNGNVRDSN